MNPRPDPRREPEDSIPVPGIPGMKTPGRAPRAHWWDDWTPAQMAKALGYLLGILATTVGAIITLIGGPDAFREIVTSGQATRAAIAASEERIKLAIKLELDATLAAERKARDELSARVVVVEKQTDWLAGFASALNEGKPHSTTPTDAFGARPKPVGQSKKAPWVVTDSPWPKRDD